MDFNKYFTIYNPTVAKVDTKKKQEVFSLIFNPYSELNLTDTIIPDYKASESKSLFETLFGKSEHYTNTSNASTLNNNNNNNNINFSGDYYDFIKIVAPKIKSNLKRANTESNLGLTDLQIEDSTRRITLAYALESTRGTSPVYKNNNNIGGVRWTNSFAALGGSKGTYGDGADYVKFDSLDKFIAAQFSNGLMFTGKYKDCLKATSDVDFVNKMKSKGYFGGTAQEYYNGAFNSAALAAYLKYLNNG